MNSYDFRSLSDKDFESLVVDLLSEEFGQRVERFKPGKDAGVDGRWFIAPRNEGIIQCKHWVGSGFKALLRHLAEKELPKVAKLNCSRYILATSVALSRADKDAITSALTPHVLSPSDVYGAEDLNDLIGRHLAVERRHYKLWLSSASTIALMMNNAIVGRSRSELEQIRASSRVYSVTSVHAEARRHLQSKRALILTGEPGIGKTTLARQLALESVAEGFEFVVIEESISEAEDVYDEESKQLFYFDDFLGRTFLQAIRPKQDSHLVSFIARVARDPRKRFILTSRTNILNQGVALSDLYSDTSIVRSTYELHVGALSSIDRARILYSQIWHSSLSPAFVDELYHDKRYLQIIKHQNFNPRLVAFVVDAGKLEAYTPDEYWAFVTATFENPAGVWKSFFTTQLSQDDRDLAYLVVLNGDQIGEAELRESFFSLSSGTGASPGLRDSQYWLSIQHLSGSVLTRTLASETERPLYSLYNPSIADYVQAQLSASGLWHYYFSSLRTVKALSRLAQMRTQPFFGVSEYRKVLELLYESEAKRGHPSDAYNLRLSRLMISEAASSLTSLEATKRWLERQLTSHSRISVRDFSHLLVRGEPTVSRSILVERANELAVYLRKSLLPLDDSATISEILSLTSDIGAGEAHQSVRSQVLEEWKDIAKDQVIENDVLGSLFAHEDVYGASKQLESFVAEQLGDLGLSVSPAELRNICDAVDLNDIIEHNIDIAGRDDDDSDRWREARDEGLNETAAIEDLFDRSGQHPRLDD